MAMATANRIQETCVQKLVSVNSVIGAGINFSTNLKAKGSNSQFLELKALRFRRAQINGDGLKPQLSQVFNALLGRDKSRACIKELTVFHNRLASNDGFNGLLAIKIEKSDVSDGFTRRQVTAISQTKVTSGIDRSLHHKFRQGNGAEFHQR